MSLNLRFAGTRFSWATASSAARSSGASPNPMNFIGFVEAADEQSAVEAAAVEYKVPENLQFKLIAHRADQ